MRRSYKKPIRKYKGGKAAREQFRDQQLNDSIMHLMRNGWGVNAISGALGNALHESSDWRGRFRGDLDPNITEKLYSGLFMNLPDARQAIIDATGGYSLENQLDAANMFANGQLPRNIFVGSGRYSKLGYSSPTEAATAWEKHYERSGGQGMLDRLLKAQYVQDYILANKDQYGRMFNPMISVRNRLSYDMPWVGSNKIELIAGINPDGTIRTYNQDTDTYSSRELELPELVVRSSIIRKPQINLKKFGGGKDALVSSTPALNSIPKFNFDAPVIEKVTPEYEEIKPKKEIPIEPVKPKEPIIPGLLPQQPISDSRFSRSHPIFKDEYDYMNSDAFLTRVKKMTNDNEKARMLATNMRNGLYYTKLPNEAFYDYTSNSQNSGYRVSESEPYLHNIYYGRVNDVPGFTKRSVIAHELGHSIYGVNKYGSLLDYNLLSPQYTSVLQRGRHKTPVSDETMRHDHEDGERIADIRALQQQAKDAGIWDKTTGVDMTPESFNKLKQTYPDHRSFDMWNDEDLRWLINTTAQIQPVKNNIYYT